MGDQRGRGGGRLPGGVPSHDEAGVGNDPQRLQRHGVPAHVSAWVHSAGAHLGGGDSSRDSRLLQAFDHSCRVTNYWQCVPHCVVLPYLAKQGARMICKSHNVASSGLPDVCPFMYRDVNSNSRCWCPHTASCMDSVLQRMWRPLRHKPLIHACLSSSDGGTETRSDLKAMCSDV